MSNGWTICRAPLSGELYARFSCPVCKQEATALDPDKAIFRHCNRVDFLTIAQREHLASGSVEAVAAAKQEQGRANFAALEAAKNQQLPAYFNEAEAFAREAAAMRRDAEALEAKRREQYEYDLRTPLPRQPTGETPQRETYVPGVHET